MTSTDPFMPPDGAVQLPADIASITSDLLLLNFS